jgi:hypothetical protein
MTIQASKAPVFRHLLIMPLRAAAQTRREATKWDCNLQQMGTAASQRFRYIGMAGCARHVSWRRRRLSGEEK